MLTPALLLIASLCVAWAEEPWTRHGQRGGVTVHTQAVAGSGVPRVMAETTVDAPPERVWDYLLTEMNNTKGLEELQRLESCGPGCEYVYHRLGHLLLQDRHYVIRMEWRKEEQDGLTAYRRWWSKSASHAPQGEGALPVTHVDGAWTLTPVDGGARTRITYLNHMDLGGSLPDGIFSTGFVVYGYLILGRFRQAFEG